MTDIQKFYHHMPYTLRVMAASVYGYYLRAWRYGSDTNHLVDLALDRESWSHEQWRLWQEEQLARILHRAATKVPYYRAHWRQRRMQGDSSSYEHLENWPVLDKETLRQNPQAFVAEDCVRRVLHRNVTSGTTGTPIQVWQSRETVKAWYALFEGRWRTWNGVSRRDRWANIGGQLIASVDDGAPPFWVWNQGLNQLYMSSYHLAPNLIPHYFRALRTYGIKYLWGYSSSLYALAREAVKRGEYIPMDVVLTNAEPLMAHQRATISEAFNCRTVETYGQAENVLAASECEAGSLHLWPEVGVVEVVNEDCQPVSHGQNGQFLCTGILNSETLLVRYRLGDRGSLSSRKCSCGRPLPVMGNIEGRIDDLIVTPDGRRVGRLDPVFKLDLPIREAQIIQDSLNKLRVCYVPDRDAGDMNLDDLIRRLRERVGDGFNITIEQVDKIARTKNGKFRAVVSNIDHQNIDELT